MVRVNQEDIPESVKQFVEGSRPRDLRLTAARGLVPATPKDLTSILYFLTLDKDDEVSSEARKTLEGIPPGVVSSVLGDSATHSGVLDYFARILEDESRLEQIVLNASAKDSTIAYLGGTVHSRNLIDAIANNHERVVRSAEIVESLSNNPSVSRSTLDGVIEYLKLYLGKKFDLDSLLESDEEGAASTVEQSGEDSDVILDVTEESFLDDTDLDQDLMEESEEEEEEEGSRELRYENNLAKISLLNVGQKIKLALLGNREARNILVKDHNRIVSRAVLKNPRLTDSEVVHISQSKVVSEDILREIAESRKWTRLYQVKLSLVNNPKTPPHISIGLIRQLRDFDLRNLRWSKNLPGVISNAVKQIMQERRERK